MEFRKIQRDGVDWTHLAPDRDGRSAFVRMEINLRAAKRRDIYWLVDRSVASQEELFYM
jgi:hypothetical protein